MSNEGKAGPDDGTRLEEAEGEDEKK